MADDTQTWTLDSGDGTLTVHTGVAGRAARVGHRLTIDFETWHIGVTLSLEQPVAVELRVDVRSLQVTGGEGGVTPLAAPERAVARANALSTLKPDAHSEIVFVAEDIQASDAGYRLVGELTINGVARPRTVDVTVGTDNDGHATFAVSAAVKQSDHDVKPYSLMMGTLKVADEVGVEFHASAVAPVPE